jgi:hypothetical protein
MSAPPPPDLRARILEQARGAPSPTIAVERSRSVLASALAALLVLALAYRFGLPPARSSQALLAVALGGGLTALAASWVVASRGRSMLGRPRSVLVAVAVVVPVALLVVATAVTGLEGGVVMTGGTLGRHLTCVGLTLAFALGPLLAFAYVRRGSDPVHPRALGAALGAAAGAWGGAMIDVHCALTTVEHLAIGHALPIALVSALGALLGAKVLGVSARG